MKKAAALLLALLLTFSSVYAEGNSADGTNADLPQDLGGGVVTDFDYEKSFSFFEQERLSYDKDNLTPLHEMLTGIEDVLTCSVQLPSGKTTQAMCRATWNTEELSLDVAGIYTMVATLIPPQGCTLGEGVRTQIALPIQILDEAAPVKIVRIDGWNPYTLAVAVQQGSSTDSITNDSLFKGYTTDFLLCEDENGGNHYADIQWDFSSLDLHTAGLYTITGTAIAPKGTTFPKDLVLPHLTATISVQATDKPDINCFYLLYPDVCFPWIAPQEQLDSSTVWLSEDGGPWLEQIVENAAGVNTNYVWLSMNQLTKGKNYRIQVDYDGGQTGILSFSWNDTIVINGYWEGDRDGDDGGGNKPPDVIQPPPNPDEGGTTPPNPDEGGTTPPNPDEGGTTPPNPDEDGTTPPNSNKGNDKENASTPTRPGKVISTSTKNPEAPFMEESNGTTTTISGLRLRLMLEADNQLQFFKEGVSVTLNRKTVAALNIADDDIFSIEILRKSDTSFSFNVSVNGRNITQLVATTISLPYSTKDTNPVLTLRHNKEKTLTTGNYDSPSSLATFLVDTTGGYTILNTEKTTIAKESSQGSSLLTLALFGGGCLLALVGGIWYVKRRSIK